MQKDKVTNIRRFFPISYIMTLTQYYIDYIFWIDVCGANGNLLAAGSEDGKALIYDRRESKIVKSFDEIHTGEFLPMISHDKRSILFRFARQCELCQVGSNWRAFSHGLR